MIAIRTENLTKIYRHGKQPVAAVDHLNLEVAAGQVYGFLGPNGAGKTTTIRTLMGLIRPSAGAAYIFGENVRKPGALKRAGALVEQPAFYGYLDGKTNLEILARTAGRYQTERVRLLLEQVNLSSKASQPVSSYSLGMKQRLGIAAALLDDPDLVILDEPTNGLDPAGISEMRAFIRTLADQQGKTVFLSSHLLNEVEQVCDRVAIVNKGVVVREGLVSQLLAEGSPRLRLQVDPIERAAELIKARFEVIAETPAGSAPAWLEVCAGMEETPSIIAQLAGQGVRIYQAVSQRQTLEAFFMQATQPAEQP